ncbi:FAD-binding oxidoreductase [Agaribacterium haliotis]|uniref:FAD-binding oxidoreductase n=1 Tax=Agaribacterium haliotis TaxID=2013869 RepID=UPI000BB54EB6|nr:FAD-binding oxidoreductase [Agaribacterium haliotis]
MNMPASVQHFPVASHRCRVADVSALSPTTFAVELKVSAGSVLQYRAGQYLQLSLYIDGERKTLSYSIANALDANEPCRLQLFIQSSTPFAAKVIAELLRLRDSNTCAEVRLAMGRACLHTNFAGHYLFIAAGSGISQIKCLTEEVLRQASGASVSIYWSNKRADDFYLLDQFQAWQDQYKNLKFTPILEKQTDDWQGRSGYIYKVIQEDYAKAAVGDLANASLYLCGSPAMVYGSIDQLKASGVSEERCYSDVFEYAPREQKAAFAV